MTKELNSREELVKELRDIGMVSFVHQVADFIIKDRERIVEPLVKHKKFLGYDAYDWKHKVLVRTECIDETLKNAGIETDK